MEKFLFQVQRYFFWRSSIFLFSFFKTKRNLRFLLFEGILTWSKAKNQKNSGLIFWGICSHLLTPSKNSFKTKKSQAFFFGFPKSKQKTRGKQKKNMFEPEIKPSPESLVFFGFLVLSRFRSTHFFWILLITLSEKSFSAEWNHSLKGQSSLRIQLFLLVKLFSFKQPLLSSIKLFVFNSVFIFKPFPFKHLFCWYSYFLLTKFFLISNIPFLIKLRSFDKTRLYAFFFKYRTETKKP